MKGIWRTVFFFLLWLLGLTIAGASQADYDPSDDLTNLLGTGCRSSGGALNALASAQAGGLANVIGSMASVDACKGVVSPLTSLQNANFEAVVQSAKAQVDLRKLQNDAQNFQDAIKGEQAKDPALQNTDYLTSLKKQLTSTQLLVLQAKAVPGQMTQEQQIAAFQQIATVTKGLFSALENAPKCEEKYPSIGAQLGGQAVAASSYLFGGLVAPVLLAAGNVVDQYVTYMSRRSRTRNIRRLVDQRMKTSMGCALEGLSSTYCQARDSQKVAHTNAENLMADPATCRQEWGGVNLVAFDLPAFNQWISRLAAGSEAINSYQAQEKIDAGHLLQNVTDLGIKFDGAINTANQAGGTDDAILNMLSSLSSAASPGGSYGAVTASLFRDDPACGAYSYFYSGGSIRKCTKATPDQSCLDCLKTRTPVVQRAGLPTIKGAAKSLITEAQGLAKAASGLSIESQPLKVLTSATAKRKYDRTAVDFLTGAISYLDALGAKPGFNVGNRLRLIKDLRFKADCALRILNNQPDVPDLCYGDGTTALAVADRSDPSKQTTALSNLLLPERDIFFVSSGLYELVQQDLDERRGADGFDHDLSTILQLSNADSLGELVNHAGGIQDTITQDDNAKDLAKSTLSVFGDTFASQLTEAINSSKADSSKNLGMACAQALLIPDNPDPGTRDPNSKYKAPSYRKPDLHPACDGVKYVGELHDGKDQNVLDFDSLSKMKWEDRVCSVYDFFRASDVMEMRLRWKRMQSATAPRAPAGATPQAKTPPPPPK